MFRKVLLLLVTSIIVTACAPASAFPESQTEEVVVIGGYEWAKFMQFSSAREYEWAMVQNPGAYGPSLVTIFYLHALEDGALEKQKQTDGYTISAPTWGTVSDVYMIHEGALHVRQAIQYVMVGDYIIEVDYRVCEVYCAWLDEEYGGGYAYVIDSVYREAANGTWDRVYAYYYLMDDGVPVCGIVSDQKTWDEEETCAAVIKAGELLKSINPIGMTEIIVEFDEKGEVQEVTTSLIKIKQNN